DDTEPIARESHRPRAERSAQGTERQLLLLRLLSLLLSSERGAEIMTSTGKTLITGAAGFIGARVAARLLERGTDIVGLDNLNAYYPPQPKRDRLALLAAQPGFRFVEMDIANRAAMESLFQREKFTTVIHLAAQAGVRYSIDHPHVYAESNLTGFLHV